MAELTGEQIGKLRAAIQRAFKQGELEQLLLIRLNRQLSDVAAIAEPYPDIVFDIIGAAEREGWTADLLRAVAAERPDRKDLQSLTTELLKMVEAGEQIAPLPPVTQSPRPAPMEPAPGVTAEPAAVQPPPPSPQGRVSETPPPPTRRFLRAAIIALVVVSGLIVLALAIRGCQPAPITPEAPVMWAPTHTPEPTATPEPTVAPTAAPTTRRPPATPVMSEDGSTLRITEPIKMELVRVPAGTFKMGGDPTTEVDLAEFYIGKYEVTWEQFDPFLRAINYSGTMGLIPDGHADHPVVGVSWEDAKRYVEWLSEETDMEFRLPSENQWEKACRGTKGQIYPWSGAEDTGKANYGDSVRSTTPVGEYSPQGDSPYYAADMVGNAGEWTNNLKVLGGSFRDYGQDATCVSEIQWDQSNFATNGFRVAVSLAAQPTVAPSREPASAAPPPVEPTPAAMTPPAATPANKPEASPAVAPLSATTGEAITITQPISMTLVHVPAGSFLMGSDKAKDADAQDNELPQHAVDVAEFYIGQYEVTNAQYAAFVKATGHRAPNHWPNGVVPSGMENHPVVNVTWYDAVAFTEWLSRETEGGFRLPMEAEWEKACRGMDGRIYPWGDEPDTGKAKYDDRVGSTVESTTPVRQYSPQGDSPYGAADMAGNVKEWTGSLYRPYPYVANDDREDLKGEGLRVVRGGSFIDYAADVRCAIRYDYDPSLHLDFIGFRVVALPLG